MKKYLGLLYKDLLQGWLYLLTTYIICIFIGVIAMFTMYGQLAGSAGLDQADAREICTQALFSSCYLFAYFGFLPSVGIMVNYEIDEKCNFTRFILASGIKRETVLNEKYLYGFLMSFISLLLLVGVAISFGVSTNPYANAQNTTAIILTGLSSLLLSVSSSIFMCALVGSVKAKTFGTFLSLFLEILTIGVFCLSVFYGVDSFLMLIINLVFFVFSLLISLLFYYLAIRVYRKKEF